MMHLLEDLLIPVLAIVMAFGLPAFIVHIYFKYERNRDRLFHESLQMLINSSQQISPEILRGIPGYREVSARNDLRRGVLTLGLGLGIACLGYIGIGRQGDFVVGLGLCFALFGLAMSCFGLYQKSAQQNAQQKDSQV